MISLTTLLVTNSTSIINEIQRLHDDIDHTRLEISGKLEKVPASLGTGKVQFLIIHSTPSMNPEKVRAALEMADRFLIRSAIVYSSAENQQTPDFGLFPVYNLPADLLAIREMVQTIHIEVARSQHGPSPLPDSSDPMTQMLLGCDLTHQLTTIRRVSQQMTTILLTGETGSGKSLMTKFIHGCSPRRDQPYLVVDCGALSGHLIESEMFGHVRGAYTGADRDRQGKFAAAGVGTLVLDEINSLPLPLQVKLLRAVEERVFEPVGSNKTEQFRARLVAVSNVPLEEEIQRERFRKDLYYRLNVIEFRIPPLRERPGAVIPLAHHLLRSSATAACQGVTAISPSALEALVGYSWPGNVRELRNVIEGAAALASGPVIQHCDLPESIRGRSGPAAGSTGLAAAQPDLYSTDLESGRAETVVEDDDDDEGSRILAVLRKHNNNRRRAAAELGMSRVSLYKKLHKSGLFVRKIAAQPTQ